MAVTTTGASVVETAEILRFWFDETGAEKWFVKDARFDEAVAGRFGAIYTAAAAGALEDWPAAADGAVALVILFDQFPRNMFRDSPQAFATDAMARDVVNTALARGFDGVVPPLHRQFLYMPLMHSERIEDQERCVALIAAMGADFAEVLSYAIAHRDIVARFGRFPHRNAVLGRESRAAEIVFLEQPGSSF